MDLNELQEVLAATAGVRVACVGDLMVDRFVYGDVARVSPEAPIPVLARTRELVMLGGSGNVARNVAALGGEAALVGVIGGDSEGHEALRLVAAEIGVEGFLVTDASRPTTLKTRFVSGGQQLLRVDLEEARPVSDGVEQRLIRTIRDVADGAGVILLSDYGKGVVTSAVIAVCQEVAAAGAKVIVDSKARSFARYGAVHIVKPNAAELAYATDMPAETDEEVDAGGAGDLPGRAGQAGAPFPLDPARGVRRLGGGGHHARGPGPGAGRRRPHRARHRLRPARLGGGGGQGRHGDRLSG
jgi:D-beta-D-heptose 7-phosphate kinase/D-beta-D-heptose 1-phosphate adenosyltransferase